MAHNTRLTSTWLQCYTLHAFWIKSALHKYKLILHCPNSCIVNLGTNIRFFSHKFCPVVLISCCKRGIAVDVSLVIRAHYYFFFCKMNDLQIMHVQNDWQDLSHCIKVIELICIALVIVVILIKICTWKQEVHYLK